MKRFLIIALSLLYATPLIAGDERVEITGQIFIATKGGDAVKLPLVTVFLFKEGDLIRHLAEKKKQASELLPYFDARADKAKEELSKWVGYAEEYEQRGNPGYMSRQDWESRGRGSAAIRERKRDEYIQAKGHRDYLLSSGFFLGDTPDPVSTSKTDAEGKFSFSAARGDYAVSAIGTRHVAGGVERYIWIASLSGSNNILLTNNNTTYQGGDGSLIQTISDDDVAISVMAGKDVSFLVSLMAKEKEIAEAPERERKQRERLAKLPIYYKRPDVAQRHAVELLPAIGEAGTPENKEFVERAARYRAEKPDFFNEPDWPVRLAEEIKAE